MMHARLSGCKILFGVLSLALAVSETSRAEQPAAPPPPKEYQVHVRYRIRATGNVRLAQFFSMTRYLESLGFHREPGLENEPEDPDQVMLTGTIAADRATKILTERHVQAILLIPA